MESQATIDYMGGEGLVHPCFLYESIWCLLGVLVLHHFSKKRKFSGQIVLVYCIWYGLERGFLELIRTDSLMWGRIRVSSLISFTLCISATILLTYFLNKQRKLSKEGVYDEMFDYENKFVEDENNEDIKEIEEVEGENEND